MSDMDSDFIPAEPGFWIIPNIVEAGIELGSPESDAWLHAQHIVGWNITTCAHDGNGSRIVKGVHPVVAFGNYRFVNGVRVESWAVFDPRGIITCGGEHGDGLKFRTLEELVEYWSGINYG